MEEAYDGGSCGGEELPFAADECDTEHAWWPPSAQPSSLMTAPQFPLHDQAQVETEADEWSVQWAECAEYGCRIDPTPSPHVETLIPWAIRRAAMLFPVRTGLGCDNVSPRAFARLSNDALVSLAAFSLRLTFLATGQK